MSSRIRVTLAEKKRSTISDLYRKKHKSELPERTLRRWKNESKSILEVKSNHNFIQSRKKTSSMKNFEDKIKSEYVKRKIKLKKRGLTTFVRQIRTDFFEDDEEISNLKLSTRFITSFFK